MKEFTGREIIAQQPKKILLYGDTGTYKTRSFLSLPKNVFPIYVLDFDQGFWSIMDEYDDWRAENTTVAILDRYASDGKPILYEEAQKAVAKFYKSDHKTLIVDSATMLYDGIVGYSAVRGLTKSKQKVANVPIPTQNDYGTAHRLTVRFIEVCIESGKNVIIVCHESLIESDLGILKGGPAMAKRLSEIAPRFFDEILHTVVDKNSEPSWQTRPTGIFSSRTRSGLDPISKPDFSLIFK